ncbi:MAG TPA: hypothetical protein VIV58_08460 [Kofleriaceae bacterium]
MEPSVMRTYWMVLIGLVFVGYAVAFMRKGKVGMAMPSRQRVLDVESSPAEAFRQLLHIARPFVIDDHDAKLNVVIVSKPVALFGGWGFFFPVFIAPGARGGSVLTVGCKSKVFQMGPLVTRAHDKAVQAILTALATAPARVA